MDASDFIQFQTDMLPLVLAQVGEPITYKGNTFLAAVSAVELGNEPVEGGLMETLGTQIIFPVSAVSEAPSTGEKVTIGTQLVRIKRVSSDEVSYELICISAKQ